MLEIVLCVVALLGSCTPSDIIVTNNEECTQIGRSLFERSATVEQTYVAVSLCEGLVHPMDSGIGGGFQALIHNARPQEKRGSRHVYLMSREYSPMDKSFRLEPFIFGNSVGVPAVLAGYARLLGVNRCIYTSKNHSRKIRSSVRNLSNATATESSRQIDYRERQSNLNTSALNKRSQSTYSYNRECVNKIQTGQTGSGFASNLRGIPYKEIFEPVIRLASRGFEVSPTLGSILNESTHLPFFIKKLPNGKATNYRLAVFMQHLSFNPLRLLDPYVKWNNRDVHSLHDIRSIMLNDVRHHGSKLTQRDFRSYRAEVRAPLTVRFSLRNIDYDLITLPSPGGGESIAFFAKMLEELLAKGAHKTLSPVQKSVMFLFLSKYTYAAKAYFRQMSAEQKRRMLVIESKKIVRELYKDIRMRPSESSLVDYWLHSIQPIPNVFGGTEFPVIKVAVKGERTRADATAVDGDEVDRETLMDLVENDEEADEDTEAEIEDVESESCGKREKCALDETNESYDFTSEPVSTEEEKQPLSEPSTVDRKRPNVVTSTEESPPPRKDVSPQRRLYVTSTESEASPRKPTEKEEEEVSTRKETSPSKRFPTTESETKVLPRKRPNVTTTEQPPSRKEVSPRKRLDVESSPSRRTVPEQDVSSQKRAVVTVTESSENVTSIDLEKEAKEQSSWRKHSSSSRKRPHVTSEDSKVEAEASEEMLVIPRKRHNVTPARPDPDMFTQTAAKQKPLKNTEHSDGAEIAETAKHHQPQKREEPLEDFLKTDEERLHSRHSHTNTEIMKTGEEVKDEPQHSRRSHTTTERHISLHSLATNMSHVHQSTLRLHSSPRPHTNEEMQDEEMVTEKVRHRLHNMDKNEGEKIKEEEKEDDDYSTQKPTQKPTLKSITKPTQKPHHVHSTRRPHVDTHHNEHHEEQRHEHHHEHHQEQHHEHTRSHPSNHSDHRTSNHSSGFHHSYSSQIHRGRDHLTDHAAQKTDDNENTHAHPAHREKDSHSHHGTHDLRPNLTLLLNERERSSRTTNLQTSNSSNTNSTTSLRLKKYVGVVYESNSILRKHNSSSLDKAVIDAFRIAGQRKGVLETLNSEPDKAVLRLARDTPQPQPLDVLSSDVTVKPSVKIRNIRHRAKYAGKLDESYEHLTLALRDIDRVEQPHNPNQFTNQPRDTEFDLDDLESRRRENRRDKKVSLSCGLKQCSTRDLEYDLDDLDLRQRDRREPAFTYEVTQGYSETPWGTTNVVIKGGNRSIVATSSINHSFGSLIFSQHLGIPYNNVLRDFTPYTWYQVDQTQHPRQKRKAKSGNLGKGKGVGFRNSNANRTRKNISSGIKLFANRPLPHSIPQSNMGCTILSNRVTRNPVFGIGAAGGFKITSAIINTMWNYFFLGESLEEAISKLRITTKLNYKTRVTEIWYEFPSQSSYQKDLTERYGLVYTGPTYKELMFAPENATSSNDTQMMGRVAHSPQFFYKYRDDLQVKYISEAGYSAATAFTTMRDLKPRGSSDPRRGGSTYVK